MGTESFERDLALYALGHLPSEDIPTVALRALESGHDAMTMAALAGEPSSTHPADLRAAFDAALHELGVELPSRRQAAEYLKRAFAADACAGARSPIDAARAILDVYDTIRGELPSEHFLGEAFDVADLAGAYCSLDDVQDDPAARAVVDADLSKALRRLGSTPQ